MKKAAGISVVMIAILLLAGCSASKREVGTVGGAAIGGVAGNLVTGGSVAGTAVGAVAGGIIGNQVTK